MIFWIAIEIAVFALVGLLDQHVSEKKKRELKMREIERKLTVIEAREAEEKDIKSLIAK